MRKILLLAIAGLLYVGVNAQSQKTGKDTTKQKNTRITGEDSVSRHNADKNQNRKREHRKNIYKDEESSKKK